MSNPEMRTSEVLDVGTEVGVDWRRKLAEVPERLACKRVTALAGSLHCLDHRLEASIESTEHLEARRARLVRQWDEATSTQLRLFQGGRR